MAFTDDEITASVESFLKSTPRKEYDTLGVRKDAEQMSDIQEAASGLFLLNPRAIFYVLWLGVQKVLEQIEAEAETCDALLDAIAATGRKVLPVEDLTPLFNSRAALRELASAATARANAFTDITKVPAYQRFKANSDRFLASSGQALKEGGDLVQTPEGARTTIPSLSVTLEAQHTQLLLAVGQLSRALEAFNAVNLSALVAQTVLGNASTVLSGHAESLDALSPQARLGSLRQVVLDVLTAQSVVTAFGSLNPLTDAYAITGTGSVYSDADHPAIPALLPASLDGAYNPSPGRNGLDIYLDAPFAPRSLTAILLLTPQGGNQALLTVAGPVPSDVQLGDLVFIDMGPTSVRRWVIQAISGSTVTVQGDGPTLALGATTVEVLPPPTASVVLPLAFAAQLLGSQNEQAYSTGKGWVIGNGTVPARTSGSFIPTNNQLRLTVNGTVYVIPLTLSAPNATPGLEAIPRTAEQICADINVVMGPVGYHASPYLAPRRFVGTVDIVAVSGASATFTLQGGFGNFGALGVVTGDAIQVLEGPQPGFWTITAVAAQTLTATRQLGGTALSGAGALVEVGSALRRLQVTSDDPYGAVDDLDTLGVVEDGGVATNTAATFGFPAGGVVQSRKLTAKTLADALTAASSLIEGRAFFVPTDFVMARANATDAAVISTYVFQGVGDTTFTPGSPNTLTVSVTGALEAGVQPGDLLVPRSGGYAGGEWDVTSVSNTQVIATRVGMLGASEVGVTVEVGPNFGQLVDPFDVVRITAGPNQGSYYVDVTPGATGLDLRLTPSLPVPVDPITFVPAVLDIDVGTECLAIASRLTTTASQVVVRGTGVRLLFPQGDEGLAGAKATSIYFLLPQAVRGLEAGDLLRFYPTAYNADFDTFVIEAVEGKILTLDDDRPVLPTWTFGAGAQVPFARVLPGNTVDYGLFAGALTSWLARSAQGAVFFKELTRLLNPLLSNTSPTAVQVNDAAARVKELAKGLTIAAAQAFNTFEQPLEQTLRGYTAKPVPAVDALVRSFREKGADRAVDLLVGGYFQEFFGLTPQGSSYAGDLQEKMREVALNDLPVRKIDRDEATSSRFVGAADSPDKDYDIGDTEGQELVPDPG